MKKRAARKTRDQHLEFSTLEPRNLLAAVSEAGSILNLDLSSNESIGIVSNNTSYVLALSGAATWNGTNNANVTGFGTSNLTITPAGLAAFDTVNINGLATNASVAFNNSGTNVYSDSFNVTVGSSG